jgi:hypothetical protein
MAQVGVIRIGAFVIMLESLFQISQGNSDRLEENWFCWFVWLVSFHWLFSLVLCGFIFDWSSMKLAKKERILSGNCFGPFHAQYFSGDMFEITN